MIGTVPTISDLCPDHYVAISSERSSKKWTRHDKGGICVTSHFITIPHCEVDKIQIGERLRGLYPSVTYILACKESHEVHILMRLSTGVRPNTLCRKIHDLWDDKIRGLVVDYEPACIRCVQVYLKGPVPMARRDGTVKDYVDSDPWEWGELGEYVGRGKGGVRRKPVMAVESVKDGNTTYKRNKVHEFMNWILDNGIRDEDDMESLAGTDTIAEVIELITSLGSHGISEAFKAANLMRKKDTRNMVEHLDDHLGECNCGWICAAQEVCCNSDINWYDLGYAIYKSLKEGRSKHNNIALIGPSNSGKTFLLLPLTEIFDAANITNGNYPFIDLAGPVGRDRQLVMMNDYRLGTMKHWTDLLNLLECGPTMSVPLPQNQFKGNLRIPSTRFLAVFMTAPEELRCGDIVEDSMMDNRWNYFRMNMMSRTKPIPTCKKCFANWINMSKCIVEGIKSKDSGHTCCDVR